MEKFSYLSRENIGYVEDLFSKFLNNPDTVDPDWRLFFEGVEFAKRISGGGALSLKEIKVYDLIRAYRDLGHRQANLNPLSKDKKMFAGLKLEVFGLNESDLEQSFEITSLVGKPKTKLKDVLLFLQNTYCNTLTVEYSECSAEMRDWIIQNFEQDSAKSLTAEEKIAVFQQIARTESLEKFLHTRFVGTKRFSIEGGDALIPMLERLVLKGHAIGMQELVIGMAHRGRINVLANFMDKELENIFAEFEGHYSSGQNNVDGDVKYHMGHSSDKKTPTGVCHISLAFNPSHLEAVDPVVSGMTRAKQRILKDNQQRKHVIPLLIHGDAAFIGQGVVSETMQLSRLEGYTIGGTIHIVVDNQVGFTTDPEYSRSSIYCTDVAKALRVPILHVNGDDVEACLRAMELALNFRQKFGQDIVVHLVCYRRFGHNEGDEPAFTQPVMYKAIKDHPTLLEVYGKQLIQESILDQNHYDAFFQEKMDNLQKILDHVRTQQTYTPKVSTLEGVWKGLRKATAEDCLKKVTTKTLEPVLQIVTRALVNLPTNYTVHPKLQKLLEARRKMVEETKEVDWGMAELLAYGSLVHEGIPVRVSGQDAGRGTFTHRHAIYHDVNNGARYNPLNTINPQNADFAIHDSSLSEMAVLGFEYGNSITDPRALTIWEAQFGDFSNGAQIIIDQFLSSAESKWQRMSGLVLLLPHGYEGQGPEHSSARLERYLQLCAQDNMQVCYPTTPAQIFHVLRRQVKRDFRKPLIIMSPKSLLRHPKVISPTKHLTEECFEEVLKDNSIQDAQYVKKCILCTGKIYYEIEAEREKRGNDGSTAIVRIEQLYPFPQQQLFEATRAFVNLQQIIWAQEEPKNMGAYNSVAPRLQEAFRAHRNVTFRYVGRNERASPAIGSAKMHVKEQEEVIRSCFE